ILALTNYQLADPIEIFYQMRWRDMDSSHTRASIVLADPLLLAQQMEMGGARAMAPAAAATAAMPAAPAPEGAYAEEAAQESIVADMALEAEQDTGTAAAGEEAAPITIRTDFNPLATFAPSERTDAEGRASVDITLPDNLTRYRVMV